MTLDRDIPIFRYEAADDFETWTPEQREADVLAWCEEHLAPVLAALNPLHHHSFGEDFARRGFDGLHAWRLTPNCASVNASGSSCAT